MRLRVGFGWLVGLGLVALWWFYAIDWFSRPGTYQLPILFMGLVLVAAGFHLHALVRFTRMTRRIRVEEREGLVDPGSTLFAINQWFRYAVRVLESLVVFVVGLVLLLAVHYPQLALNVQFGRLILTYFVGTVVATGYLTYRDIRVLNRVKAIDLAANVVLASPSHRS